MGRARHSIAYGIISIALKEPVVKPLEGGISPSSDYATLIRPTVSNSLTEWPAWGRAGFFPPLYLPSPLLTLRLRSGQAKEGKEGVFPLPNEGEGWGEGESVNELVNTYKNDNSGVIGLSQLFWISPHKNKVATAGLTLI